MADEQQGPASAGPPPGYRLKGPAHAHSDAPCGPECYEPIPPATPELDKMAAARKRLNTQDIGEFLEWLGEQGIVLCAWHEHIGGGRFHEIAGSRERLLATYAEVDLDKIEQERRAVLDHVRSLNP